MRRKKDFDYQNATFWKRKDVCDYLGVAPETLMKMIAAGIVPAPLMLGKHTYFFKREDVIKAVDKAIADCNNTNNNITPEGGN